MDKLFSVEGQVVLVSGGSRGIGRAIAQGFAERGAQVVITGRQKDTLEVAARAIAPAGHAVRPIVCDVSKPQEISALVKAVLDEFRWIDTLVNVAGVNRRKPALDYSEEDFDFVLNINLKGAFLLSQAVGRSNGGSRPGESDQRNLAERGPPLEVRLALRSEQGCVESCDPLAGARVGASRRTRQRHRPRLRRDRPDARVVDQ